jgi:hypothetical protein
MVHALAWAIYYIFLQGNSHDLHLKIGIQFHASFMSTEWREKDSPVLLGLEAEAKRDEEIVPTAIIGYFNHCFCTKGGYEVPWNSC